MFIETNYRRRMTDTPLSAFFHLQRTAIRQTGAAAEELLRFPAEFGGTAVAGVDSGRGVVEQAVELSRQSAHRSLDAAESVAGGDIDQLRGAVDEAFNLFQAQQDSFFGTAGEQSELDQAAAGVQEQVDFLLEFNEAVEAQVETLLDGSLAAEEFPGQLEDVLDQFEQQVENFGAAGKEATTIEIESGDDA